MISCLDLEGVLVPEIWIQVARKTGIPDLRLTTRDISDYDVLMKRRIAILRKNGLRLKDVQSVIGGMRPLPGAKEFLRKLRSRRQVVILSDTFYEFAMPLMEKLDHPTLLCNRLETDRRGFIRGYRLRQREGKEKAVLAFKKMGFCVAAAGDSYNDISMLKAAHSAVLFKPPARIAAQFPKFRVVRSYGALLKALCA